MSKISRRSMLAAAPAAAAALAITAAPALAASADDDAALFFLIAAHADAKAESDAAWTAYGEMEDSNEEESLRTPVGIHRSGEVWDGWCEVDVSDLARSHQKAFDEIARTHERERVRILHVKAWSPEFAETLASEVDASEQRALAALEATVAAIEASPMGRALAAAWTRCGAADEALARSHQVILDYRPVTLAGAEAKIEWLLGLDLTLPTGAALVEHA
jgi:hypothetical protein